MLQELKSGRLENEFYNINAEDTDPVLCIKENRILVEINEKGEVNFPTAAMVNGWSKELSWNAWGEDNLQYAFRMQGTNFFLWMGEPGETGEDTFHYEELMAIRRPEVKEKCFAAFTAFHLYHWYRNNRYCGRCQTPTVHDTKQRMLCCPNCGNLIFPRISPAVIIAVTNGEKLLLSKYAGRSYTQYALLAGYTEIGETMEETVHREVMEEVGLKVKNIRYYKSQPWGKSGIVLMGFFCDLDGSDEIHLDEEELSQAGWYDRQKLPIRDDGISLTREMIRVFQERREPK